MSGLIISEDKILELANKQFVESTEYPLEVTESTTTEDLLKWLYHDDTMDVDGIKVQYNTREKYQINDIDYLKQAVQYMIGTFVIIENSDNISEDKKEKIIQEFNEFFESYNKHIKGKNPLQNYLHQVINTQVAIFASNAADIIKQDLSQIVLARDIINSTNPICPQALVTKHNESNNIEITVNYKFQQDNARKLEDEQWFQEQVTHNPWLMNFYNNNSEAMLSHPLPSSVKHLSFTPRNARKDFLIKIDDNNPTIVHSETRRTIASAIDLPTEQQRLDSAIFSCKEIILASIEDDFKKFLSIYKDYIIETDIKKIDSNLRFDILYQTLLTPAGNNFLPDDIMINEKNEAINRIRNDNDFINKINARLQDLIDENMAHNEYSKNKIKEFIKSEDRINISTTNNAFNMHRVFVTRSLYNLNNSKNLTKKALPIIAILKAKNTEENNNIKRLQDIENYINSRDYYFIPKFISNLFSNNNRNNALQALSELNSANSINDKELNKKLYAAIMLKDQNSMPAHDVARNYYSNTINFILNNTVGRLGKPGAVIAGIIGFIFKFPVRAITGSLNIFFYGGSRIKRFYTMLSHSMYISGNDAGYKSYSKHVHIREHKIHAYENILADSVSSSCKSGYDRQGVQNQFNKALNLTLEDDGYTSKSKFKKQLKKNYVQLRERGHAHKVCSLGTGNPAQKIRELAIDDFDNEYATQEIGLSQHRLGKYLKKSKRQRKQEKIQKTLSRNLSYDDAFNILLDYQKQKHNSNQHSNTRTNKNTPNNPSKSSPGN